MAGNYQKMGKTPLELLDSKREVEETILEKYGWKISCAALGAGFALFYKFARSRPLASGIQSYFIYAAVAGYIGKILEDRRTNYLAERDAMLRHYIELHPEDFPIPERVKYADLLNEWIPIR